MAWRKAWDHMASMKYD